MPRMMFAIPRATDSNNAPVSGALLYVFEAGTTNPVTTYSNVGLTVANTSPVIADAAGVFSAVYLAGGTFKIRMAANDGTDLAPVEGVTLWEADNVVVPSGENIATVGAKTVSIPSDYADLGAAADGEGDFAMSPNSAVTIQYETGEQVTTSKSLAGGNWSNVDIDAVDSEVDASSDFPDADPYLRMDNVKGLTLDALIDMQGYGNNGLEVLQGSSMVVEAGAGVKNTGANGDNPNGANLLVIGGDVNVDYDASTSSGAVFDGAARRGVWATIGGSFAGKFGSYLNVGTDPAISEGNAGAFVSRNGSWYDDNCDFSGSVRGIRNGGGEAQARDGILHDIDGTAIWNFLGGLTKTEQVDFSRSGYHGDWSVYGSNFDSSLDISGQETAATDLALSANEYRMAVIGANGDDISEYVLVEPGDIEAGRRTTTLNGAVADSATSITVANGNLFPTAGDFVLQIGSERVLVTSRSTHVLTVTRGVDGTSAAAHSSGDTAKLYGSSLNGAINNSATTITVADASILPPAAAGNWLATIGSERVLVTGISGNDLTVTRGADGTSAAAHSDNDAVSIYVKAQSVAAREATPTGVAWGNSGTNIYIVGTSSDQVHRFSLSTAYDLTSTFNYVSSFSISSQTGSAQGVRLSADGTRMYVLAATSVYEYALSTAWDVTSASYTDALDLSAQVTDARGFDLGDSGNRLFVADQDNDRLTQWDLSTAYDVSTAIYSKYDYLKSPGANNGYTAGTITGLAFSSAARFFFTGESSGADHVFKNVTWNYSVLYVGGPQANQPQGGGTIIAERGTFDGAKETIAEVDAGNGVINIDDSTGENILGPVATITAGNLSVARGDFTVASSGAHAEHGILASDLAEADATGFKFDGGGVPLYAIRAIEGARVNVRGGDLSNVATSIFDVGDYGEGEIHVRDMTIDGVPGLFPNGATLRPGTNFATRAEAVTAVSNGWHLPNGKGFTAAGLAYVFDSTAGDPISDMPDVKPVDATPEHYPTLSAALSNAVNFPLTLAAGQTYNLSAGHTLADGGTLFTNGAIFNLDTSITDGVAAVDLGVGSTVHGDLAGTSDSGVTFNRFFKLDGTKHYGNISVKPTDQIPNNNFGHANPWSSLAQTSVVSGTRYVVMSVASADWSAFGGPASASVGDTFTATSSDADISAEGSVAVRYDGAQSIAYSVFTGESATFNSEDFCFAIEVTIDATPSGVILDAGNASLGAWLGFTNTEIVFRVGDTSSASPANCSNLRVAYATACDGASLAGKTGVFFGQIDVATEVVYLWFYETSSRTLFGIGQATPTGTWTAQWYGGTQSLGLGRVGGGAGTPTGETATNFSGTVTGAQFYIDRNNLDYEDTSKASVVATNTDNNNAAILIRDTTSIGVVTGDITVHSCDFAVTIDANDSADVEVGDVFMTSFVRGFKAESAQSLQHGRIFGRGLSSNSMRGHISGQNAYLFNDIGEVMGGDIISDDTGEHGARGGFESGGQEGRIHLGTYSSKKSGQSGLKVAAGGGRHEMFTAGRILVEDAGYREYDLTNDPGLNEAAVMISAKDFDVGMVRAKANAGAHSGNHGLDLRGCESGNVGSLVIQDADGSAIRITALDEGDTPRTLNSLALPDIYLRDTQGDAVNIRIAGDASNSIVLGDILIKGRVHNCSGDYYVDVQVDTQYVTVNGRIFIELWVSGASTPNGSSPAGSLANGTIRAYDPNTAADLDPDLIVARIHYFDGTASATYGTGA